MKDGKIITAGGDPCWSGLEIKSRMKRSPVPIKLMDRRLNTFKETLHITDTKIEYLEPGYYKVKFRINKTFMLSDYLVLTDNKPELLFNEYDASPEFKKFLTANAVRVYKELKKLSHKQSKLKGRFK
jgi:hypothetical protein